MLPWSLLLKVVRHQFVFDGVCLRVDVAISPDAVDHLVKSELHTYVNQQLNPPTAIGYNYVFPHSSAAAKGIVVLCLPNNYCFVAKVVSEKPNSKLLEQFLEVSTDHCFVKAPGRELWPHSFPHLSEVGTTAGELVARFRKEPSLYNCNDLGTVAQKVGVAYDESISPKAGLKINDDDRGRYWDGLVFTEDEIRDLVYRPYICCKIGQMLIRELQVKEKSEGSTAGRRMLNEIMFQNLYESRKQKGAPWAAP